MNEYVTQGHLGGYVKGGDDATFYPDLWRWFVDEHGVRSVLDVGCGEGHAMRHFGTIPYKPDYPDGMRATDPLVLHPTVRGIDGIAQPDWRIYEHDYTTGSFTAESLDTPTADGTMRWRGPAHFDLIWCCEFVEHVEEQYVPNFLETFKLGRIVAMTHAEPGQPGYHHVHLKPAPYWIEVMSTIDFELDEQLTGEARGIAALNRSPWNHFLRSGLVFRRAE